jgi:hydrophobic/amphiphilic exporter-1 (mainly G- bacteria), HAE1 family
MVHGASLGRGRACLAVVTSIYPLFRLSGMNFVPDEDESRFQISVRLPVGTSLAATQSLLDQIGREIRETLPGVTDTLAIAGFSGSGQRNGGNIFVRLAPLGQREHSQQELATRARALVEPHRTQAVIAIQGSGGGIPGVGGRGGGLQYALVGPDLTRLDAYTQQALAALRDNPLVIDADRSYLSGLPELRLGIDRQRAGDFGIPVETVSQTVNALMAGQDVTTFNSASDQYDVILMAEDAFRRTPDTLAAATVRTAAGELVPLRNLVTFNQGEGPASIDRLNRQRQITLSANWAPNSSQAEAQEAVETAFAGLGMAPGYQLVASGQSQELDRAIYYFGIAFLLSFIFMYMVLAAQFESFIHPITILLTLPVAVPFGLLASLLLGQNLNIYSALCVLLLFGIVKKNAILQIDHTIGLRELEWLLPSRSVVWLTPRQPRQHDERYRHVGVLVRASGRAHRCGWHEGYRPGWGVGLLSSRHAAVVRQGRC